MKDFDEVLEEELQDEEFKEAFEEEKETISFNQMLKELIELHGDDFWKE